MSTLRPLVIAPLLFSLHAATAFADDPPKLDVTTTCNLAALFSISEGRDKKACLDDEHAAETTIEQAWSKYAAGDKAVCIGTVKIGGPLSSVELLSCLEIMLDAEEVRADDSLDPSDHATQTGSSP